MRKLQITCLSPPPAELKALYRQEKDARLKERYQALYLMHEMANAGQVAALLSRDKKTILSWIKAFNAHGIEGLKRAVPPGKASQLTPTQLQELKEAICKNPRELGYEFSTWDGKSVAHHIQQQFGVQLGARAVQKILHKLGFTLQRPKHHYAKANPKAQAQFQDTLKKRWLPAGKTMCSCLETSAASNWRRP
jgi:putative transposase